jgi:hypothetical protein
MILASLLLSLSFTAIASADPTPDVRKMAESDCARARALKKTCVLDIPAEDVNGKTPTAGDTMIAIPTGGKVSSLIHIRRDFIMEILKSAEDL